MIPKVIHYCWFGGRELPNLAKKCIASWRRFCPDYEIRRWDESNFDVTANGYARWCFEKGKWAFLSDYARLAIVARHGGLYFDTDVELLRSPDEFLEYEAFFGMESGNLINTGLGFGAAANHPAVLAMLDQYADAPTSAGQPVACPWLNTQALESLGYRRNGLRQMVAGALILPEEFMAPLDDNTGRLNITPNTVSIHRYAKSWVSPGLRLRAKITRPLHRMFGEDCFAFLRKRP